MIPSVNKGTPRVRSYMAYGLCGMLVCPMSSLEHVGTAGRGVGCAAGILKVNNSLAGAGAFEIRYYSRLH